VDEQSLKLEDAMVKYENFLNDNESIETIGNELSILLESQKTCQAKLATLDINYNTSIMNNDINIKTTQNTLSEVTKVLSTVDKKLVVNKTIVDNDLLREVITESGLTLKDLTNINLEEESYNENYLSLISRKNNLIISLNGYISNKEIITEKYNKEKELTSNKIDEVSEKLENLQVEFAEVDHQNQLITNEMTNARATYELLINKYNEIKVTESVKAGEMNLVVNSKAYASDNPVSPNKKLNLAIGLVLGLMIGVFIVFFMNMWKNEEK
ncbi:MAG: GNVR domain-containing protein, partial [Bacillota bacterium]|nr:GNVR domain-containing protein [Bacillota bacterium]